MPHIQQSKYHIHVALGIRAMAVTFILAIILAISWGLKLAAMRIASAFGWDLFGESEEDSSGFDVNEEEAVALREKLEKAG